MVWVYIAIIMLMRVVQSVFTKANANSVPKNGIGYVKYTAYYQALASAFALILFVISIVGVNADLQFGQTLLYASISGVCLAIACACSLYTLTTGTMVLSSLFGTAGLLVPTIAGIFLYNEQLSALQWIAIALFMVGAYFLAGSSKRVFGKFTFKTLIVLIISLLANGATMLMQTMFGRNVENGNTSLFSFLSFLSAVVALLVVLVILLLVAKKRNAVTEQQEQQTEQSTDFQLIPQNKEQTKLPKTCILCGIALSFAVFVINQLATLSTPLISPVILFAFINGGATIISAVVGLVMYKEKINWQTVVGLVVGLGSLIMLKVFA